MIQGVNSPRKYETTNNNNNNQTKISLNNTEKNHMKHCSSDKNIHLSSINFQNEEIATNMLINSINHTLSNSQGPNFSKNSAENNKVNFHHQQQGMPPPSHNMMGYIPANEPHFLNNI